MSKLLVVAGDSDLQESVRGAIGSPDADVSSAATAGDGRRRIRVELPDVVVVDLGLPDGSGIELFESIRTTDPKLPVVLVVDEGTVDVAIDAMRRGAFDYLVAPFDRGRVKPKLTRALAAARLMRIPVLIPHDGRHWRQLWAEGALR